MYHVLPQCFLISEGCWKNKSYISKLITVFVVNVIIYVIVSVSESTCLVNSCQFMVVTEAEIYPDLQVLS